MGSVNKVILVGRLGRDAETRYTPSGAAVSNFSLATSNRYKDKSGEWQESTEWHRCVLFGKAAESLSDYLKKGKEIYAEGRLQTRKWTDKDGQDRYSTEIVVDRVQLLGGKRDGQSRDRGLSEPEDGGASAPVDDSEIPF